MTHSLHIDHLPAARREATWRDAVCDAFVRLECRPDRRSPLHGTLQTALMGNLHVARVASSPQFVERTPAAVASASEAFVLVSLQLAGRTVVQQAGRQAVLEPGTLAFYDTSRPYTLTLPSDFDQIVLHLPRDALAERLGQDLDRMALRLEATHPYAQALVALGPQLLQEAARDTGSRAPRAAAVAVELIALALSSLGARDLSPARTDDGLAPRASALSDALVWRARDLIARQLADPELCPPRLARQVGVSLRRLQEAFQASGSTAAEAIWQMRLEFARQQLASATFARRGVGEIALAAGFSDLAHFSRRFRQRYGFSPSQYRASRD